MKLGGLTVVDADINVPSALVLYIERPETARQLVIALALAVAKWALESLALADDDASAKYCSVAYVFHDGVSFGVALGPRLAMWLH